MDPYIAKTTYCTRILEGLNLKGMQSLKTNYILDGIKAHYWYEGRIYKVVVTVEPDVAEGEK